MKKRLIDAMVNAFLGWQLPKDFAPDCYINFDREKATVTPHRWPVGTNLFTADQARQMFEHVVDKGIGLPTTEQAGNYLVEVCHGASAAAGWWGELEQTGDAFATLKAEYVKAWEATPLRDTEGRERIWQAVQIIGKVESHLIQQVQNGKIAEADIQRLRKG